MTTSRDLDGRTLLICTIFESTPVFLEMAKVLRSRGCRVVWTATHRTWYDYLIVNGESREQILDLRVPRTLTGSAVSLKSIEEINEAERRLGLTLGSIVMMDRFLMDQHDPAIWRFLVHFYETLKQFLVKQHVDMALGEPTNASDVMTFFVAEVLGIPYRHISSVRIPSTRSALFTDYAETAIVEHQSLNDGRTIPDVETVIAGVTQRGEKPLWFAQNNRRSVLQLSDARGLLRNLYWYVTDHQRNLTSFRIRSRIIDRFRRLTKKHYVKRWLKVTRLDDIPRPFALFALQVQPESSVDVFSRYASNQLEVIRNARRALPSQYALVVKEHSNLLGGRGPSFFGAVAGLPNTFICSPFLDSHMLIRESAVVLSVTGTILYEAALSGTPSISFAEMFFNRLSLSFCCADPRELVSVIHEALVARQDHAADAAFMEWLLRNSVEGSIGDAVRDPGLLDPVNVSQLCRLVGSALENVTVASSGRTAHE